MLFFGFLIHIADSIPPLIHQIERIERADKPLENLPQEEEYVIRNPVATFSGIKNQDTWTDKCENTLSSHKINYLKFSLRK